MKKIAMLFLSLMILTITGCGGGGSSSGAAGAAADTYTMSVLPTKYAVDVPASISGTAPVSKSSKGILQKVISKSGEPVVGDTSQGCEQMKSMTGMMKQMTGMMGFFAVLADASISQNDIPADGEEYDGTVTLTQGMIDAVAAIMPADMADASDMASAIGQSMPAKVTYSHNTSGVDYPYSVLLTMTSGMGSQTAKIYWNEAKTKTKLELIMDTNTLTFTYDDTAKLMTASMASTMGTMEMSLKDNGTGTLFFANMEAAVLGTFRMEGYADDIGGYIKTTLISSSFGTSIDYETFNADGIITSVTNEGQYFTEYNSGTSDITTLQGEIGFSKTVTGIANGEYIVLTSATWDGTIVPANVVGYGVVTSNSLLIQDIGGGAYNALEGTGSVYLYKANSTFMSETPPTFVLTAVVVPL